MTTFLGEYLNKLDVNKSKIAKEAKIKIPRMNDLCNDDSAKIYADEFYKILYLANHQARLTEDKFNDAVDEIFPNRPQVDLMDEFKDLSPEAQLFKKYTQKQGDIEEKLGIATGKISKYFGDKKKRALATEIIAFADGMKLDILTVFKEVYGKIVLEEDKKNTETT
ncbi:MAG: hypothetical protein M5Z89_01695 [Olivibacter sp.]|nr:hypothetical protein [Olivibacter sp. UJ_SKK_5.1]